MTWLRELFSNPFLLTGVSSWAWAQVIKTVIHALMTHRLDLSRLVGDGGMPSGHSATGLLACGGGGLCLRAFLV